MPKANREFLKAYEWTELDQHTTDQQKGLPRPELQKPIPPNAQLIDLIPPEEFSLGTTQVIDVILRRASHRRFNQEALTLEELSFLLWASQGVREMDTEDGITYVMRTVPSGGNRHPMETYLSIHRVAGIENGLYRYLPLDHQLGLEKSDPDLPERGKAETHLRIGLLGPEKSDALTVRLNGNPLTVAPVPLQELLGPRKLQRCQAGGQGLLRQVEAVRHQHAGTLTLGGGPEPPHQRVLRGGDPVRSAHGHRE